MGLASLIPAGMKDWLRAAVAMRFFSDLKSFRTYNHLLGGRRASGPAAHVRLRPLGGASIELRPGSTDAPTVFSTFFHRFHLPPRELALPANPVFLDLGANIGLTVADLAVLYPSARVIGVELDRTNAELARRNIAPWKDRCTIVQAGVWFEDGEIEYSATAGSEDGFRIGGNADSATLERARTCRVSTILAELGVSETVDYVKMDIEGAEKQVLRQDPEWLARVRSIKVELHDYTAEECIADLQKAGFKAWVDPEHSMPLVVGINPKLA